MKAIATLFGLTTLLVLSTAEAKPLSAEAVDRVISKHESRVTHCYVQHATTQTGGKLILKLHIKKSGRVKTAKVQVRGSNRKLERCITHSARRWRFPRADTKTFLHYPFVFRYATR